MFGTGYIRAKRTPRLSLRSLALGAVAAAVLIAAPSAGAATWSEQSVPAVPSANGQGWSVSCASATACTQVGFFINPLGVQQPTAEAWNGTSWAIQTVPLPGGVQFGTLRGISCASATACTAVGTMGFSELPSQPLAERWNGTSWTAQTVPLPAGSFQGLLNGVSCSSTSACTAVGSAVAGGKSVPFAARWDGTNWSAQTVPSPSGAAEAQLNGVSCSGASRCIAVGHYTSASTKFFPDKPLAEGWNGSGWSLQAIHAPSGTVDVTFGGVSCSAPLACTAVGGYSTTNNFPDKTLAARFTSAGWTIQTTPNPTSGTPTLVGVSCPTATDCTAVGPPTEFGNTPVVEQWNGTSWALQSAASPSGMAIVQLSSVSCTAATACTAVGGARTGLLVPPSLLTERWDGTAWTLQPTPGNRGALLTELMGLSCSTASSCIAVGDYMNNNGKRRMLAESWNGTSWANRSVPLPSTSNGVLNAVSCTSPTACTAVGTALNANSTMVTLAERWDGANWTVQSTPNPTGSTNATFEAVSCASATLCMAAGKSVDGSTGHSTRLVAQWNGTSWTLSPTPSVPRETFSEFTGVSCPSSSSCMAVGGFSTTGTFRSDSAFAEQWNGAGWSLLTPAAPAGTTYANLTGVSCTSATACTAAGGFATSSGAQFPSAPLAERWNGSNWLVQATPNPSGIGFTGASCPAATACTAVGSDFAEGWNGTSWTTQTLPFVSGGEAELSAVSCTAATACTGTGRIVINYLVFPLFANSTFIDEMWVPLAERSPISSSIAQAAAPTGSREGAAGGARRSVKLIRLGRSRSHPPELAEPAG